MNNGFCNNENADPCIQDKFVIEPVTSPCEPLIIEWFNYGNRGRYCQIINENSDPDGWNNNFLCTNYDIGLRFSNNNPKSGMDCILMNESSEPYSHAWSDNYLCLPTDSPHT